ncbi:GNAT family N-acetyltransferase [Metabacillus bambusae]|uniref:GNAT family N-acetyltransferase n=1 Tax=Metabacillus bambusae TaxID=2795218 RepID=A0ABS3N644_9BACI|nr:GNAT family protein [Metabacillus bambusae]MBO1513757.1 GNAT family N-acetyltransferase [Metabacillus bambusae]
MKLKSSHVFLRPLEITDAEDSLKLELRNREFFQNYTSLRDPSFYTLEGQLTRIKKNKEMQEQDQYYLFGIFLNEIEELIGYIMLSEIMRGPIQHCFIGYFLDKNQNGKGYMTEAVHLMVTFAFKELKLHRIEAGVIPHNIGSIKVLEKSGFHKEGIAKKNVKINGRWEDHQVLAIINEQDI